MSRPYKITVKESLQKTIASNDHVKTNLDIPQILPKNQMQRLLRNSLEKRGFITQGNIHSRTTGNITVEINDDEVIVKINSSVDINIEEEGDVPSCSPCAERAKVKLKEAMKQNLQNKADKIESEDQKKTTKQLEDAIPTISCELERISHEVTTNAIIRKASELGEISKIEKNQDGSVKVVIKIPE